MRGHGGSEGILLYMTRRVVRSATGPAAVGVETAGRAHGDGATVDNERVAMFLDPETQAVFCIRRVPVPCLVPATRESPCHRNQVLSTSPATVSMCSVCHPMDCPYHELAAAWAGGRGHSHSG